MTSRRRGSNVMARSGREQGFTLITMALVATAMIGAMGLSVDLGRLFIAKNETQQFVDAAALAAALQLDGTSTGIANAKTAATSTGNTWNFNSTTISSPTVKFGTTSTGTWVTTPASPSTYYYVQVSATVSAPLYFLPLIVTSTSQNVVSSAVAGQIPLTTIPQGLAPYTAVSTNTTGPYFGLTVGQEYDIQWPQYNSNRGQCPVVPSDCFNPSGQGNPCAGDLNNGPTLTAVVNNWGANINGYWGASSNNTIAQEILDVIQLQAVSVGTNIEPVLTNGNKASEAVYLDDRAAEDTDLTDNTVAGYLAATHNGRRLLAMPIVDPLSPNDTNVIGYGQFLLYVNNNQNYYQKTVNGNGGFCAIYAGPYNVGSTGTGTGASSATQVKLVQ